MEEHQKETKNYTVGHCKPPISPGRTPGIPNKATQQAREAIALFVDNNAHRLQEWLDAIAHGGKYTDGNGKEVVVQPNPTRAYELFNSVIEYHIPKLSRTESHVTAKIVQSLEITTAQQAVLDAERAEMLYEVRKQVEREKQDATKV